MIKSDKRILPDLRSNDHQQFQKEKETNMADSNTQIVIEEMEQYDTQGDYNVAPTHQELKHREYNIMSLKHQQKMHLTYIQDGIEVNKGERSLAYHVRFLQDDAMERARWFDGARDWQMKVRIENEGAGTEISNMKLDAADRKVAETKNEFMECQALFEAGLSAYEEIVGTEWSRPTKSAPKKKTTTYDRTAYDTEDMSEAEKARDKLLGARKKGLTLPS